ncbi:MAG: aldo/keto reductase family protein [Trueperaceae bacterium]|nr:aldo/keto reductase family protein [Trueperaceae bacterium]HRQ09973.1 aldo/keto reductase family protein [Trueperaceae bacterium]
MSSDQMTYRRLGNSGLKVSSVSLGGWTTYGQTVEEQNTVRRIIDRAVELGVNFFDAADVYAKGKCEEMMGEALAEVGPRHHLVVSSKLYWPMSENVNDRGLSRKHIMESIDLTLDRMGLDYLDIYFAHRFDDETPLEETVEAFSDVVRSGRTHYWGTSMWSAAQIAEAVTFAKSNGLVAPVVEQPEYSMLRRERVEGEIMPTTSAKGVGLVVFSPLAQGLLTGKYDSGVPEGSRFANFEGFRKRHLTEDAVARVRALKGVADDLGVTRSQLALAWVLRNPNVSSVITGATRVEQLEENVVAAGLTLNEDTLSRIDEALAGD